MLVSQLYSHNKIECVLIDSDMSRPEYCLSNRPLLSIQTRYAYNNGGRENGSLQHIYWPRGYKIFLCSTQLSMIFQLPIKSKNAANEDFPFFQPNKCWIYHANKC